MRPKAIVEAGCICDNRNFLTMKGVTPLPFLCGCGMGRRGRQVAQHQHRQRGGEILV